MLPHGTGRNVRVGVFASGEDAAAALAAGAHATARAGLRSVRLLFCCS